MTAMAGRSFQLLSGSGKSEVQYSTGSRPLFRLLPPTRGSMWSARRGDLTPHENRRQSDSMRSTVHFDVVQLLTFVVPGPALRAGTWRIDRAMFQPGMPATGTPAEAAALWRLEEA